MLRKTMPGAVRHACLAPSIIVLMLATLLFAESRPPTVETWHCFEPSPAASEPAITLVRQVREGMGTSEGTVTVHWRPEADPLRAYVRDLPCQLRWEFPREQFGVPANAFEILWHGGGRLLRITPSGEDLVEEGLKCRQAERSGPEWPRCRLPFGR